MYISDISKEQRELERRVLDELSPKKAFELLRTQVKIGERLSGTPEALEEINLIKKNLEGYGMDAGVEDFKSHISIPQECKLKMVSPEREDIEAAAFAWSAETPPDGIEGELVFVGFGREEDYQGKDVKDMIVFASLGGPISRARKTEVFMSKRAKAMLTFNNFPDGPIQRGTCKSVMGNPTPELLGPPYVPNKPAITIDNKNGLRLVEMCKEGPVRIWFRVKMDQGWKDTLILETSIEGRVEPEKFVMLAAHYDSWGPEGVGCNAVGVAGLLELARVFNKFRDQIKRSIRFVFWGAHELGMGASGAWYIDNHWDDIQDNLVLYSMFDTIGIKDPTVLQSNHTPEMHPFYVDLLKEVPLPPYIKKVEFGVPRGGADIGTFTLYPCVTVIRDLAVRDYGNYTERSDFLHSARDTMEFVAAPNMFEPVFKTLPVTFLRFCNLPVLPVDFSVNGERMLTDLNDLNDKGKGLINLDLPIRYAGMFAEECTGLYQDAKSILAVYNTAEGAEKDRLDKSLRRINKTLIRLSRVVNRVLLSGFLKWGRYSAGLYVNDFDHGVLASRSIPSLVPLEGLINFDPESDEYGSLLTKLVRERNRIADSLKEAVALVQLTRKEIE